MAGGRNVLVSSFKSKLSSSTGKLKQAVLELLQGKVLKVERNK